MGKTIIIEIGRRGRCDVRVYDGECLRDIEKAIDLDDGLVQERNKISREDAAEILKTA